MMVKSFKERFGVKVNVSEVKEPEAGQLIEEETDINDLIDNVDRCFDERLELFRFKNQRGSF